MDIKRPPSREWHLSWVTVPLLLLLAACAEVANPQDKPDTGAVADLSRADSADPDAGRDMKITVDHSIVDTSMSRDLSLSDLPASEGPALVTLTNESPCISDRGFSSLTPGDPGDMKAVRLTPAYYPFTVTHVRYSLEGALAAECNNTLAHRVEIFAASGHAPKDSPSIAETIPVPAVTSAPSERTVLLPLATPLQLQGGEHLYVAMEQAGNATQSLCLYMCLEHATPDRNYWSESSTVPYGWEPYTTGNLSIEALGY